MWDILIYICFLLINLSSSLPTRVNNEVYYYRQIRSDQINRNDIVSIDENPVLFNICAIQSINIDTLISENDTNSNLTQFASSWQRTDDDDDDELNVIQIIFTIPYLISNESILNKTVFIIDVIHNQLLASLTNICMINASSFLIDYSTMKSLPHNICLYLLLDLPSSTILREIMFCRTIDDLNNNASLLETSHVVGPSGFFIISQCIIILIMMLTIYGVHKARQKSLVNHVRQRLFRSRPYITIFGNKAAKRTTINTSITSANSLQAGLNQLGFHCHFISLPSHPITTPIEEQVLAANDLTSTITDRRATRPCISRDLIDIKEFTKRMSVPDESLTDVELHTL